MEASGGIGANMKTYVVILGVIEMALITTCGFYLSKLVGTKDTSNQISATVLPIVGTLGGIVMFHAVIWWIWFQYMPSHANIYLIVMVSICLICSLTAMAISLVNVS